MIAFSGIDCGGKSTQIEKVRLAFDAKKRRAKVIHSRGGSVQEHAQYREAVHGKPK